MLYTRRDSHVSDAIHCLCMRTHIRVVTQPIVCSSLYESPALHVKPIGIMPKVTEQIDLCHCNQWEIDITENTVDMEVVVPIFVQSINRYKAMNIH